VSPLNRKNEKIEMSPINQKGGSTSLRLWVKTPEPDRSSTSMCVSTHRTRTPHQPSQYVLDNVYIQLELVRFQQQKKTLAR
jgi:hypothetical protein